MNEMTIDDFVEQAIDSLRSFRAIWQEKQSRYPEDFPIYMEEFCWMEKYGLFVEGNE